MKDISILIPTYNDVCAALVSDLQRQATALDMHYEIIVADDGSTDTAAITANRIINQMPCCRYLERQENAGRAAIRNFLASEAQYPWLLFIDGDMVICRDDYLRQYAASAVGDVVCGGVSIGPLLPGNLRSMYERAAAHEHTLSQRQNAPYHDFHTANFLVRRELMLQYPFDQRFRYYGYEDVFFGKQLQQNDIPITHIDNPLSFERFETNTQYVLKTEEGLRTLYQFRSELKGFSRLLDVFPTNRLLGGLAVCVCRLWHCLFGNSERRNLTGNHPSLLLFKLYKLGYFAHLH